jgi:hypothetical protein
MEFFPSYYFQQSLKLLYLPKVTFSRAFSYIKSEQKLNVSVNLLMMEVGTIFETSDFRLEFKRLTEVWDYFCQ